MIGHYHSIVSYVAECTHYLEEIHISIVRVHLLEIVPPALNISEVNIKNLFTFSDPLYDWENLLLRIFQPFGSRAYTQIEAVVRTVGKL